MKLSYFFFLFLLHSFAQEVIVPKADQFVGIDIYENVYYLNNGTLFKKNATTYEFKSVLYGHPDEVDISNPLQIWVFYQNFNKVVILDNRLNIIEEFDLPNGTSSMANAGNDKIWLYNSFINTIQLFNFRSQKIEKSSLPLSSPLLNLRGSLNEVSGINTKKELVTFNFLAREINRIKLNNSILSLRRLKPYKYFKGNLFLGETLLKKNVGNLENFDIQNQHIYLHKDFKILKHPVSKK